VDGAPFQGGAFCFGCSMLAKTRVEYEILGVVAPLAEGMGYDVTRIRFIGSMSFTLQIMAERSDTGRMSVGDCAKLSRVLSISLDAHGVPEGRYSLEVSSPGIDRSLTRIKDFESFSGHLVKVETKTSIDGRMRFKGTIVRVVRDVGNAEREDAVIEIQCGNTGEIQEKKESESVLPRDIVELRFSDLKDAKLVLTDELIAYCRSRGDCVDATEGDYDLLEYEESVEQQD
jgi:ribosome maturation factor RimP